MAYATYSRGYKSGGVNIDNTAAGTIDNNPAETRGATPLDPRYKSEFIDGYEIGAKLDYLQRRARSNFAVFYDEMKDLQVAQFLGTQFAIVNAPQATVYGAEVENRFALTDFLTLGLDLTWLPKAEFGVAPSLLNLSGREFPQAPKLTGNLSFDLDRPVSSDHALFGRLAMRYSGEQFTNTSNDLTRGSVTEYDLSIGLKSMHRGWSLNVWCQNCSDERYITQHFNSPLQGTDSNGYVAAPRTYGATFRWVF
jgi:outer membrane receptor protein involved in Fe transport